MSIIITAAEIESWRETLANSPGALAALAVLADCEGDLDDAAISLAIQVGQEPTISDRWLDGLAKRWRHILCEPELQAELDDALNPDLLQTISDRTKLPPQLATLVAIYVIQTGVANFCKPLSEKIN